MDIPLLKRLLDYNAEEGAFTWRYRPIDLFAGKGGNRVAIYRGWNNRYAGQPALWTVRWNGYLGGVIRYKFHYAQRVAWCLTYNEVPEDVDHINGDRADNRISNLRSVSREVNCRNMAMTKRNTSGVVGVCFYKRTGKWRAFLGSENLGYYSRKSDAIRARRKREREGGYHENHGRPLEGYPSRYKRKAQS